MAAKDELGRRGEDLAARYLEQRGYRVLDRNWRCVAGEVDIVAAERDEVAFVEVKTRSSVGFGHPFEAISAEKLERMRRVAALWCEAARPRPSRYRLDVIGIVMRPGRLENIEHLQRVFR